MTETATGRASPTIGGSPRVKGMVAALALSQTIGYGVLHYAFAVLLSPIARDLQTSTTVVTAALTVSVLVAAVAAIPVGRWMDRHGGRHLMTTGSIIGVVALVAWSQIDRVWQLYAVFVLIGLASAASLYEAAFAVIIASTDRGHRDRALLAVTVVAGFASSIFFPLTGILLERLGWRATVLVFAGLLAVTAVPIHATTVPTIAAAGQAHGHLDGADVRRALQDSRFWRLGLGFLAQAAAVSAVSILLVTYLRFAGHAATMAASMSGLLGVLSVTGRLLTTRAARRYGMTAVASAVFAVQAGGLLLLPLLAGSLAGAAVCVIAFGLGFGVATIARPAILADRYGTARYATIAATMALPITLAKAFAPLGAAALAPNIFVTVAGLSCLAGAVSLWTTRYRRAKTADPSRFE